MFSPVVVLSLTKCVRTGEVRHVAWCFAGEVLEQAQRTRFAQSCPGCWRRWQLILGGSLLQQCHANCSEIKITLKSA